MEDKQRKLNTNIANYLEMLFIDIVHPSSKMRMNFLELILPQQILLITGILNTIKDKRADWLYFLFSLFFESWAESDKYLNQYSSELLPFLKECLVFVLASDLKTTHMQH